MIGFDNRFIPLDCIRKLQSEYLKDFFKDSDYNKNLISRLKGNMAKTSSEIENEKLDKIEQKHLML